HTNVHEFHYVVSMVYIIRMSILYLSSEHLSDFVECVGKGNIFAPGSATAQVTFGYTLNEIGWTKSKVQWIHVKSKSKKKNSSHFIIPPKLFDISLLYKLVRFEPVIHIMTQPVSAECGVFRPFLRFRSDFTITAKKFCLNAILITILFCGSRWRRPFKTKNFSPKINILIIDNKHFIIPHATKLRRIIRTYYVVVHIDGKLRFNFFSRSYAPLNLFTLICAYRREIAIQFFSRSYALLNLFTLMYYCNSLSSQLLSNHTTEFHETFSDNKDELRPFELIYFNELRPFELIYFNELRPFELFYFNIIRTYYVDELCPFELICFNHSELLKGKKKLLSSLDHIHLKSLKKKSLIDLAVSRLNVLSILAPTVQGSTSVQNLTKRIKRFIAQSVGQLYLLYGRIFSFKFSLIISNRITIFAIEQGHGYILLLSARNIIFYKNHLHEILKKTDKVLIKDGSQFMCLLFRFTQDLKRFRRGHDLLKRSYDIIYNQREFFHAKCQTSQVINFRRPNRYDRIANETTNYQRTNDIDLSRSENGEEKCVIETRSRSKSDCNGHCTQTCTVTPIKLDSCTGDITIDQPSVSDTQCSQKGPNQPYPNSEEPVFSADFSSKLDEVSDHYMKQGLCEGEECSQLRVQQGNQRPHIKLEFIDGVLHQKFIFMQTKDEVNVDFDVCVIFNDGTKTPGCDKPEFKTYLEEFDKHKEGLANLESALLQHLNSKCASKQAKEKDEKKAAKAPEGPEVIKETKRRQSRSKNPQEPNIHDGKEVKMEPVEQLPDSELPDTSYQIGQRYHMATPTTMDCNNLPNIKFSEFTSTFLSVTAKQVDLRKHIDFETVIRRYYEEPVCMTEFSSSLELDNLPGMINRDNLQYQPESGLREVLQKLGGEPAQRVEVIGTRIANALKKNMTSWILTNVAALYWRVEGDAKKAIDCLRLSLTTAPRNKRDTALISIANIFHRAGYINDAIFTTNLALDTANKVAVSHFTMANLYAVKAQWDKATMFYESTLGLQSTFEPAKQRLKAIKCKIVMQKPVAMPTD
ncbi:Hypothetical predicted protein, partial [Mytilus galloprovincialis]